MDHKQEKKEWTILIYIAGDNDLYKYALRNIEQIKQVGSTDKVNFLIYFNLHESGNSKETRRYYVDKNQLLQIIYVDMKIKIYF